MSEQAKNDPGSPLTGAPTQARSHPIERGVKWLRIAVYYVIAIACSALTRVVWHVGDLSDGHSMLAMYWHLLSGVGPFIGAVTVWLLFRPERVNSFGGSWPVMAWAMLAVPAVVMGVMGVSNTMGVEPHLLGLHMGTWIGLYAILEETGWRGYLQGEFRSWPAVARYATVGLFWYAWHLTFLQQTTIGNEMLTVGFIVMASVGIGFVADRTGSILAAAAFHIAGNIIGLTSDFRTLMPDPSQRLWIVGICFVLWLIMLRVWRVRRPPARTGQLGLA